MEKKVRVYLKNSNKPVFTEESVSKEDAANFLNTVKKIVTADKKTAPKFKQEEFDVAMQAATTVEDTVVVEELMKSVITFYTQ